MLENKETFKSTSAMLDLFRRLEKEPDSYRGLIHLSDSVWFIFNEIIFFLLDHRDDEDEEYDEDDEEGSEYTDEEHEGSDNEDCENVSVGLTAQQEELLQIVSFNIVECVPKKKISWTESWRVSLSLHFLSLGQK